MTEGAIYLTTINGKTIIYHSDLNSFAVYFYKEMVEGAEENK